MINEIIIEYFLQNWALILILLAFGIMLRVTVFLGKKTAIQLYILIGVVFLLSIIVYAEFYLAEVDTYPDIRITLMAIRYSATPIIIAFILYTLVKKAHWYVLLPAFVLAVINIISIPTGIVFSVNAEGDLVRGALGYLPYIGVGLYSFLLILTLVLQSNKQPTEIIPIAFLGFSFISGIVFPLVIGKDYSKIFSTNIAVSLFVYYVFLVLQLTKKDALTGLLNRQAYYAFVRDNAKDITAFVSIDMNGLKAINDNGGHLAGDTAIETVGLCLFKASKTRQQAYRIGGDEFMIVCKKNTEEELKELIERIKKNISETKYAISIGYSYAPVGEKDIEKMVKDSDEMMYQDKADYYIRNKIERRHV